MTSLESIFQLPDRIRTKRLSSYDRSGNNHDYIRIGSGDTAKLADIEGAGCIKHIWITLSASDPMIRRNAVIRMYWDGEEHPSVESPLGDFFGQGWGEEYNFASLPIAASPSEGKSLNCYFPMPFAGGARIELENQSGKDIDSFYFYIDYEERDEIPEDAGRFHAWWNRELTGVHPSEGETEWGIVAPPGNNTTDQHNYLFADLAGKGKFVGIQYYVDNPGPVWYGEGDDMWMIDGEDWPGSMHGTGTEDFFNAAWCPNEVYLHPYFGYAKVPNSLGWMGRTHCYRFFLEDPIHFSRSLRASIEHGHNNNLTMDLSTVAYWYQTEPHRPFKPLPPRECRQNMPIIRPQDVHYWRHAYRQALGSSPTIWGHERLKT